MLDHNIKSRNCSDNLKKIERSKLWHNSNNLWRESSDAPNLHEMHAPAAETIQTESAADTEIVARSGKDLILIPDLQTLDLEVLDNILSNLTGFSSVTLKSNMNNKCPPQTLKISKKLQ